MDNEIASKQDSSDTASEEDALIREIAATRARVANKKVETANIQASKFQNSQLHAQLEALKQEERDLEAKNQKLLAAPCDAKPLARSEKLPEAAKNALRRLFVLAGHHWNPENQQILVDHLLGMQPIELQFWAIQLTSCIAADEYDDYDLSPEAMMKGSTGLVSANRQLGDSKSPKILSLDGFEEVVVETLRPGKSRVDADGKIHANPERIVAPDPDEVIEEEYYKDETDEYEGEPY